MIISGQYKDTTDKNIITVTFNTDAGEIPGVDTDMTIDGDSSIKFAYEPVTVTENIDDVFDEIITLTADISLYTDEYLGDLLFAKSPRQITCTISKNDVVLFDGYVAPAAYNQPYVRPHDQFTINCVDKLATLQYYYYENINTLSTYESYLNSAGMVSFSSLLDDIFDCNPNNRIWDYNGTKTVDLDSLFISEAEILGESFDDLWTKEEVLIHVCRYLTCHAKYDCDSGNIILFSWNTSKNTNSTYTITGLGDNSNIMRSDMDITIDDVYSQIMVKDNVTAIEDIVSSPLDDDTLSSPYSSAQHWMTEYISDGEGKDAWEAIQKIMGFVDGTMEYDGAHRKEWYFQLKQSQFWDLYDSTGNNINHQMNGTNQTDLLEEMRSNKFMPMFISVGKNSLDGKKAGQPSPLKKPNLENYLVISVNGDLSNKKEDDILDSLPAGGIMRYNGFSAANLTPADDTSTNYIIIDGKITLSPIVIQSGSLYHSPLDDQNPIYSYNTDGTVASTTIVSLEKDIDTYNQMIKPRADITGPMEPWTVPSNNNPDGRYYWTRFYKQTYPSTLINNTQLHTPADDSLMLYPIIDVDGIIEQKPYSTSARAVANSKYDTSGAFIYNRTTTDRTQQGNDTISKLPILACRMTVGDEGNKYYLVEEYDANGKSIYNWYHENNLPVIDNRTIDFFTIGIDPNLGDRIIGQEFNIQDNTGEYGIDATGMAIPITQEVPVSGRVEFSILGPVNIVWNGYVRKHPTMWRHTSYYETGNLNLLSYISNIWISEFSIKIYTDNGYADNKGDSDIYYISDETSNSFDYIAGKHETEFKFITQLTTQECSEMDVKNTINVNSVLNGSKTAINKIVDRVTGSDCKAEEHYVKEYYDLTSQPKMIVTVTVKYDEDITYNKKYYVTSLPNKQFMLLSKEHDLKYNTTKIKLREI